MQTKLTADFVETATAEPGKDRSIYWDSDLRGFGRGPAVAGPVTGGGVMRWSSRK